jgi:hypothetical protein
MARSSQRTGLALSASLVLHAALLLVLGFLPGRFDRFSYGAGTSDAGQGVVLSLMDPVAAAPVLKVESAEEEQHAPEQDFHVAIGEGSAAGADTSALPAPSIVAAAPRVSKAAGAGVGGQPTGRHELLIPPPPDAKKIVYLLDRSLSMGLHGALKRARREIVASVEHMPPSCAFEVIAYNRGAEELRLDGEAGFHLSDVPMQRALAIELERLTAAGTTNHLQALLTALQPRADVIYLITDADDLGESDVRTVTRLNAGQSVINTIEISRGRQSENGPLRRLASLNGGSYRHSAPGD